MTEKNISNEVPVIPDENKEKHILDSNIEFVNNEVASNSYQDDFHNTCLPIKKLDEFWNYLKNPPRWSSRTIELVPREQCAISCENKDCHVEECNFKPNQRFDKNSVPRTLVCHDMKGGYLLDRYNNPTRPGKDYTFYQWSYIDTFVYFSHHLVTIPPLAWINVAHKNGVKVLGTFITEWNDGKKICDEILNDRTKMKRFIEILVDICVLFRFDGWLLNIENTVDNPRMLIELVKELTKSMHIKKANSLIIWYDSVTNEGKLKWQNELNINNRCFFDVCDGIFLNYTWTEQNLSETVKEAKHRLLDVYVGLDVWGRNFIGGGKFNSHSAAELIRKYNLSMAVFAPGWTHESLTKNPEYDFYHRFLEVENTFWRSLRPYLYNYPIHRCFSSAFYTGSDEYWYNLEVQDIQLTSILHSEYPLKENDTVATLTNTCNCLQLNRDGYMINNTSCRITNKHLDHSKIFVHQLMNCDINLEKNSKIVLHTITKCDKQQHDEDNIMLVVLVQDENGTFKKILCKSNDQVESSSGIQADFELFPIKDYNDINFIQNHSRLNDKTGKWKLRCYWLNIPSLYQSRVLKVGAILKRNSSILLGGIGIQKVFT